MNFITSMWTGVMKLLGLYKKDARIIFLGLDDAGKTTLLSVLKDGRVEQFDPTIHAHAEELEIGKLKLCTVDLGGHETVRKVWRDYFPKIDAIVYLIDASNSARFGEGKEEFDNVMETPDLGEIPILILGNKIDKKGAVNEEDLRAAFGLVHQTPFGQEPINNVNGKPIKLLMCSIAKKFGFKEGFEWLEKVIP